MLKTYCLKAKAVKKPVRKSDEERNSNVLVEARPLGTLCGRVVFRPNRLDL